MPLISKTWSFSSTDKYHTCELYNENIVFCKYELVNVNGYSYAIFEFIDTFIVIWLFNEGNTVSTVNNIFFKYILFNNYILCFFIKLLCCNGSMNFIIKLRIPYNVDVYLYYISV